MVSCSPSHLVLVAVASQSQVAGGGGLQQETLPAQEGPGTEVAFSVPASVTLAFQCPPKKDCTGWALAGWVQTPDIMARPPLLFMGERVCCGT